MSKMSKLNVHATPQLVSLGPHPEDGGERVKEVFLIWATNPMGYRWQHDHTFDDYLKASEFAARVGKWVHNGGKLDMRYWREIEPAYGSQAYVREDCEFHRYLAERIEESFGSI